jgi:hypothetical protein
MCVKEPAGRPRALATATDKDADALTATMTANSSDQLLSAVPTISYFPKGAIT